MKERGKSLALLLTAVLLCNAVIASADTLLTTEVEQQAGPAIVQEVIEKRGANEKHFLREDGSYTAVIYGDQVHYESNGEWLEVDNTLTPDTSQNRNGLVNRDGLYDVYFDESPATSCWGTLSKGECSMSWSIDAEGRVPKESENPFFRFFNRLFNKNIEIETAYFHVASDVTATVVVPDQTQDKTEKPAIIAQKAQSRLKYQDALAGNIDVEYSVAPSQMTEEIVLKSPNDVNTWYTRFSLTMLIPVLQRSGDILLNDADGQTVFSLSAPIMVDADGNMSDAIAVELLDEGDGQYTLIKTPDTEWLNADDRSYPVRLRYSSENVDNDASVVTDTYVYTNNSNGLSMKNEPYLWVGKNQSDRTEYYSYIKFHVLPLLRPSDLITHAELTVTAGRTQSLYNEIDVAVPLSDWTTGLSWEENPMHYAPIDKGVSPKNTADGMQYSLDITEAAGIWYKDISKNYGVKLYSSNAILTSLFSSNATNEAYYRQRPSLRIDYLSSATDVERGHYFIRGVNNKYMEVYGDKAAQHTRIMTAGYSGNDEQIWLIDPQDDGTYIFSNESAVDYQLTSYFDFDLAEVYTTSNQYMTKWYLYETSGGYLIRHSDTRTRVLDVYGMTTGDAVFNQDIFQFKYLNGDNQKWKLELFYRDKPLEENPYNVVRKYTESQYLDALNNLDLYKSNEYIYNFDNYGDLDNFRANISDLADKQLTIEMKRKKLEDVKEVLDIYSQYLPLKGKAAVIAKVFGVFKDIWKINEILTNINKTSLAIQLSTISQQLDSISHYDTGGGVYNRKPSNTTYTVSMFYNLLDYRCEMRIASSDGEEWYSKMPDSNLEIMDKTTYDIMIGTAAKYTQDIDVYKVLPIFSYDYLYM